MPIIELTQGQVTRVDQCDYDEQNKFKWHAQRNHNGYYYANRRACIDKKQITLTMAREILKCVDGMEADHINRDTLDNRRSNLREVTHSENQRNKIKSKKLFMSSRYKGVNWHKHEKKWNARIGINGKRIHLGYFSTEEEAALAYNKKAIEIDAEHFYINKIEKKANKKGTIK